MIMAFRVIVPDVAHPAHRKVTTGGGDKLAWGLLKMMEIECAKEKKVLYLVGGFEPE
jgi:hypothetical protein